MMASELMRSEDRSRGIQTGVVIAIVFFSILSLGAWWDGGKNKSKKEAPKKETPKIEVIKVEAKEAGKEEPGEKQAQQQETAQGEKESKVVATAITLNSEEQKKEIERIQKELNDIINRTQQLQNQVKDNRTEIQSILQRAQIHERILRDITLPQPVQMKYQINPDEILKQEKLRLIGEQTRQTQEQLRVIQQTRSLRAIQSVPTNARASRST